MSMWSVALPADDPQTAALHRAAVTSLPARLAVAENGTADRCVVSGRAANWLERAAAAITAGARALLISGPEPVPVDEARQLARRAADADVIVAVDSPYVCDPTFTSTLPRLHEDIADAAIIDSLVSAASTATTNALGGALLAQLAVVRRLLPTFDLAPAAAPSAGHYLFAGSGGDRVVTLAGVRTPVSNEEGLQLDLVGVHRHWHIRFHTAAPARPTELTLHDAAGQQSIRPRYESAQRASWRALHQTLESGTPPAYTLDDLIVDVTFTEHL
jgi:hypothetical protein